MNEKQLLLIFILCVFISPNIFSGTLQIDILSPLDKPNTFYISNNNLKEIDFRIIYFSNNSEAMKAKIFFEILPSNLGVDISLSNQEFNFFESFESNEKIYVSTKTLREIKNIQLKVKIFDKYNNLLETKTKYIKLIPNNSEENYIYSPTHTRPRLLGYNLSRSVAVINGKKDSDNISVFVKNQEGNIYSLDCSSNDQSIVINYSFDYSKTDLNISIKDNGQLKTGEYFINCKLQDGYETMILKEIKIIYTDLDQTEQIKETPKEENKITGFLSLPKIDNNKTYVLFAIFIIIVILIIFSKTN